MAIVTSQIKSLFIGHLNRLYCAKAHLVERLVDICDEPMFADIKPGVEQALAQTELNVAMLDRIYELLGTEYTFGDCDGLINFLEDTFSSFQANIKNADVSYILFLSYLHRIACVEKAEKKILLLLAEKMNNPKVTKLLGQTAEEKEEALITALTAIYTAFIKGAKFILLALLTSPGFLF